MNLPGDMWKSLVDSTVLVVVVAGLFRLFETRYKFYLEKKRARQHYAGMTESIELSEEIQILRTRTHFHRIVIAKVHNGGEILHPATAKFTSVLEDSFSNELGGSIKQDYQNIIIDNQYKEVLHRSMTSKYYHINRDMLGPDSSDSLLRDKKGILYNVYQVNSIKSIFFIYLGANKHGLVLMSLQSQGYKKDLDSRQLSAIRIALPSIRKKLHIHTPPKFSI